ncbi:hypothetical protein ASG58_21305 [Rhizobium sp. Leaf383]|nr:hypothetical protein ASG58_21305 [Rhizobium sp. Leaf383]
MIFVIAPGTKELVPLGDLFRMKLPLRYGWDGWIHKDKTSGRLRRFPSYRRLRAFLDQPAR